MDPVLADTTVAPMIVIIPDAATVPELPELAHNPWELATWGIIGLVAVIAFWIWTEHRSTRSQIKGVSDMLTDVKGTTDVVRAEVKNDHPDDQNLRDQIDLLQQLLEGQGTILKEIKSRQDDHGRDIRGIRTDVGELRGSDRHIKEEHDDLVRRLNGFIRREHPGADPL